MERVSRARRNQQTSQDIPMLSRMVETRPTIEEAQKSQAEADHTRPKQQAAKVSPRVERRPFDLVILGASGSVGSFLVEELALVVDKHFNTIPTEGKNGQSYELSNGQLMSVPQPSTSRRQSVPRQSNEIKWAIAGRSAMRLHDTLNKAELSTGIRDLSSQVAILLADLNQHRSLLDVCSKTKVLINCAGPYSIEGEAVIRACLETKTHYLDLAHETNFVETIRRKYSERAEASSVYIINGCGFLAMSAEMGLNFVKQIVDGRIDELRVTLNLNDTKAGGLRTLSSTQGGIVTWGMWCSFILDHTTNQLSAGQVPNSRYSPKQTKSAQAIGQLELDDSDQPTAKSRRLLERKDTQMLVQDLVEFQNHQKSYIDWIRTLREPKDGSSTRAQAYSIPTNSFTNEEAQLLRGEMTGYELRESDLESVQGWRPIKFSTFMSAGSFLQVAFTFIWLLIFGILIQYSATRALMRHLPWLVSLGNVNSRRHALDRDSLSHIKFCQTFIASGTPGDNAGDPLEERQKHRQRKQEQLLVARVVGPEPNHVATATFAIQAALSLLLEVDHLPNTGGVLTPGVAFAETNIIYQLRRRNIKFEVLKKA